jgi:hypothetical protein
MGDDSLRWQRYGAAEKLQSTITGRGITPPALLAPGFLPGEHLVSCIEPITVADHAPNNVLTLPAARRSDPGSEPVGRAYIGERLVRTSCSVVGNTATLGLVAGATGYEVLLWPEFTALVRWTEQSHRKGQAFNWSLTLREV